MPTVEAYTEPDNEPTRRWVFTHWLKGQQTPSKCLEKVAKLESNELVRYCITQAEGPNEEGKIHLQGYMELTRSARFTQVKTLLWKTTRWGKAKADGKTNTRYCTKTHEEPFEWPDEKVMRMDGTEPVTFGTMGGHQGHRTDLDEIQAMLDSGCSMGDIAREHFGDFVRYHRGFSQYRRLQRQSNRGKPEVQIYWGDSGTGKSLLARTLFPASEDVFWLSKPNSGKGGRLFWDGYDGHTTVVIDEFYAWIPYDFILRLIDYGPLTVETKGGSVPMCATRFIFTSNTEPEAWYNLENKPYQGYPLLRRFDEFASIQECDREFLQQVLQLVEVYSEEEGNKTGATAEDFTE